MTQTHKTYTVQEARHKLEQYCAYQERCHREVLAKLQALHIIPQVADEIVVHLIDQGFLNEERFACSFARGKFRIKQWGKKRIVQELKARDISAYNIKQALKEIPDEEYTETFIALAARLWQASTEQNLLKKKKKTADLLLRKGYEPAMVFEELNRLEIEK